MEKIVLIITSKIEKTTKWSDREVYIKAFCEAVESKLKDTAVLYTTYEDLYYSVRSEAIAVYDTRNKIDLKEVNLVHFRNWMYDGEEAPLVAVYLRNCGIGFFNSEVDTQLANGKISQMFLLAIEKLPVPDTFYAHKNHLKKFFAENKLPSGFEYPLIMKSNDGSRGDDNYLVNNSKEALEAISQPSAFEKEFVLQTYLPNDGDYRLLFIGEERPPLIFRRRSQRGSHLNNTSKGGSGEFVEGSSLPPQFISYGKRAVQVLKREIGGVDILVDKRSDKPYILEVNSTPALASGYGLNEKINEFATFLQTYSEVQEEE